MHDGFGGVIPCHTTGITTSPPHSLHLPIILISEIPWKRVDLVKCLDFRVDLFEQPRSLNFS